MSSFVKKIKYIHGTFTNSFIITPLKQKTKSFSLLIINLLILTILIRKMGNSKSRRSKEDHQKVRP